MSHMMLDFVQATVPRSGNNANELEDAVWPATSRLASSGAFRCAVADGAGETSFAGDWARLLVRAYCERDLDPPRHVEGVERLGRVWHESVFSPNLPWYAIEKLEKGAFAALLGVEVRSVRYLRGEAVAHWTALAIGDCCGFHICDDRVARSFPLSSSNDFTRTPMLVSTSQAMGRAREPAPTFFRGRLHHDEQIIIATDALAQWFLRSSENAEAPWNPLGKALAADGAFADFVCELRASGRLRNDDVALARLRLVRGRSP